MVKPMRLIKREINLITIRLYHKDKPQRSSKRTSNSICSNPKHSLLLVSGVKPLRI
jgi:hypothetical protein